MSHDVPWAARPGRELLGRSWPVAIAALSSAAMTLTGTAFVARAGDAEVAGVGVASAVMLAFTCFGASVLQGLELLVAHATGARRRDEVRHLREVGLLLAVVMGALIVVVVEIATPLTTTAAAPAIAAHAAVYLRIRALAAPLMLATIALRACRWGEAEVRTPMQAALIANLVNTVLDATLILGLDAGVAGAALAAVIASAVELLFLLGRRPLRLRWHAEPARALWRYGGTAGVQRQLEIGVFLVMTATVSRMPAAAAAAHQLVLQLACVAFLPVQALAQSASILTGHAIGAGRDDLVGTIAARALAIAAAYTAACALAVAIAPEAIAVALGAGRPQLAREAVALLPIAIVFVVADAANELARGILRGAGDVAYPALVGVIAAWTLTPLTTWTLGLELGYGPFAAWVGMCAELLVGASLLWARIAREHRPRRPR